MLNKLANDLGSFLMNGDEYLTIDHCRAAEIINAIAELESERDRLKEGLEYLWAIIDDIDTYGDMAKADDKLYRKLVERRQGDRWTIGVTSDGYKLDLSKLGPGREGPAKNERTMMFNAGEDSRS